jgi:hypothetical protein
MVLLVCNKSIDENNIATSTSSSACKLLGQSLTQEIGEKQPHTESKRVALRRDRSHSDRACDLRQRSPRISPCHLRIKFCRAVFESSPSTTSSPPHPRLRRRLAAPPPVTGAAVPTTFYSRWSSSPQPPKNANPNSTWGFTATTCSATALRHRAPHYHHPPSPLQTRTGRRGRTG